MRVQTFELAMLEIVRAALKACASVAGTDLRIEIATYISSNSIWRQGQYVSLTQYSRGSRSDSRPDRTGMAVRSGPRCIA